MGFAEAARGVDDACARWADGDLAGGRASWADLPGQDGRDGRDVQAVLIHGARRTPRLARAAVARAARLVPLLVRLQEALAAPAGERFTSGVLASALDASTEIFGAGAFELEALAAGDYGVDLDGDEVAPSAPSPPAALLALLVDAIAGAARDDRPEAALDAAALETALVDLAGTPLPPTAELFLTPAPHRAGARPGTGWLLGLHAPAGASLGRFVHALGAPAATACGEIATAERAARPVEERVDVAFAPSGDLGDLTAHPPVRGQALALSRWTSRGNDLTAGELLLEADPASPEALALHAAGDGGTARRIVPSPFARVRAATAPAGAARLLVGWSLQRQHAPWAFSPGPLADLAFLPRLVLDGFVIAPASWRMPPGLRGGRAGRAALARWRREAGVPRMVQVGTADELYPVDLEAPEAGADLRDQERVFEIWPPLEATVDRDGRRLEAVVAVVDDAPPPPAAPVLGKVAPPRREPPLVGWRTFKLFGAAARQDALLTATVVPAVSEARRAGEIDAWFFLRYLDGPGERPHLRLRAHATGGDPAAFERRLRAALESARRDGTLAAIETGDYFPERGRFAQDELAAVHAIFQADSEAVAELAADAELDRLAVLPLLHDGLTRGLGLDLAARHALARRRRRAGESWTATDDEERRAADAAFRRHGRALRSALLDPAPPFARLETRVAAAAVGLTESARARLSPTLLHLEAVRLVGPDPDAERIGYTFWERALEGLRKTT
jgi:thiopeptide-type bacteriocin biosynthesis protein